MNCIDSDSANKVTQFLMDADVHRYMQTSRAAAMHVRRYPRESVFRITQKSHMTMYREYRNIEVAYCINEDVFDSRWVTDIFQKINPALVTTMAFTTTDRTACYYKAIKIPVFPNVTHLWVNLWVQFSNFGNFPAVTELHTSTIYRMTKYADLPHLKKLYVIPSIEDIGLREWFVYVLPVWPSVEEITTPYVISDGFINLRHITVVKPTHPNMQMSEQWLTYFDCICIYGYRMPEYISNACVTRILENIWRFQYLESVHLGKWWDGNINKYKYLFSDNIRITSEN